MARNLLNSVSSSATTNILGMYYQQSNVQYYTSGSTNGSFGTMTAYTGTNHFNQDGSASGYVIKEANSYLHILMNYSHDHGQTWRASGIRLLATPDNWSTVNAVMGFGLTSYNGNGYDNFGNSGCQERYILHNSSVGTTWKFAFQESGHANGNVHKYNNANAGNDNYGQNNNPNTFGDVFGMCIRVIEVKNSAVVAMSAQNTFAFT